MISFLDLTHAAISNFDLLHFAIYDQLEALIGINPQKVSRPLDDALLLGVQFLSCYLVVLITLGPVLLFAYLCWCTCMRTFFPLPTTNPPQQQHAKLKQQQQQASSSSSNPRLSSADRANSSSTKILVGTVQQSSSGESSSNSTFKPPEEAKKKNNNNNDNTIRKESGGGGAVTAVCQRIQQSCGDYLSAFAAAAHAAAPPVVQNESFHARARIIRSVGKFDGAYRLVKVDDRTIDCLRESLERVLIAPRRIHEQENPCRSNSSKTENYDVLWSDPKGEQILLSSNDDVRFAVSTNKDPYLYVRMN